MVLRMQSQDTMRKGTYQRKKDIGHGGSVFGSKATSRAVVEGGAGTVEQGNAMWVRVVTRGCGGGQRCGDIGWAVDWWGAVGGF